MSNAKVLKINIGSGPHGKPDWVNLDWGALALLSKLPWLRRLLIALRLLPAHYKTDWPSQPRLCDCRKKLPFADGSVDFAYSSSFLEHLPRWQALKLLRECHRVLHPGGVLRISVPDLRLLAEKYVQRDQPYYAQLQPPGVDAAWTVGDSFVSTFQGHDMWSEPDWVGRLRARFIRGHLWMYDFHSLSRLLMAAGFKEVAHCEAGVGRVPDLDFLDIHREQSLYVEAVR
jgi:SAM-dependent methyltransferase